MQSLYPEIRTIVTPDWLAIKLTKIVLNQQSFQLPKLPAGYGPPSWLNPLLKVFWLRRKYAVSSSAWLDEVNVNVGTLEISVEQPP